MNTIVKIFSAAVLAMGITACADPGGDDLAAASSEVTSHPSFITHCHDPFWDYNVDRSAIIVASASSCQKRDGTWGGHVGFAGSCTTDVANCDGNLRCGRCP